MMTQNIGLLEEMVIALTPDQQQSLERSLQGLELENPDNIRLELLKVRSELGIDLTPWNTSLSLQPKINEVLSVLSSTDKSTTLINCNKKPKEPRPAVRRKPLRILTTEEAAKAKADRIIKEREQEYVKRCDTYSKLLGSYEKVVNLMLSIPEIAEKSNALYYICLDKRLNTNNITVSEIVNNYRDSCNDIYNSIYRYAFYYNGEPSIYGLEVLVDGNIEKVKKLDCELLLTELPRLLTQNMIVHILSESANLTQQPLTQESIYSKVEACPITAQSK
jgi:hypothetical protein